MYLKEEKYSFHILEMLRYAPAVLVEGHDEALVLDAGNGGVVAVLARENLLSAIFLLATDVRVLRPVEPEQGHHHLSWGDFNLTLRSGVSTLHICGN